MEAATIYAVGKVTFGAVAAIGLATVSLPLLGFGGAGVAAGSAAAAIQSAIGNVAAGSVFAALQSAGAAGLAATTKAALAGAGAVIAALI